MWNWLNPGSWTVAVMLWTDYDSMPSINNSSLILCFWSHSLLQLAHLHHKICKVTDVQSMVLCPSTSTISLQRTIKWRTDSIFTFSLNLLTVSSQVWSWLFQWRFLMWYLNTWTVSSSIATTSKSLWVASWSRDCIVWVWSMNCGLWQPILLDMSGIWLIICCTIVTWAWWVLCWVTTVLCLY